MMFRSIIRALFGCVAMLTMYNPPAWGDSWGSGYSRYGVGEVRYFPHERSAGMGGTHIALLSTNAVNTMNPAAWTRINRMRFSISTTYEGYAISNAESSTFLSGAQFNGFAFAIPISMENGFTLSAGLTPYSKVNYNILTKIPDPSFPYTLKHVGEGGLSAAHIGASVSLKKDWHFGAKFNYLFGTLNHNTEQLFTSSQLTNTRLNRSTRFNGGSLSLGLIYSGVGEVLKLSEANVVTLGVLFTTGAKPSTILENFYEYTSGGTVIGRDSVPLAEGVSSLPLAFGAGLSYTTKDRYTLAADFYYQNWSRFDVLGDRPAEMRDSYRMSIGAEILPMKELSASYFQKTSYQLGLFYNTTNWQVRGKNINEGGITGGIGLPLFGETRMTVTVEYAIRGSIEIEKDNILRVSLTLNTGELWFSRPPEE